jgi:hypothetical protein
MNLKLTEILCICVLYHLNKSTANLALTSKKLVSCSFRKRYVLVIRSCGVLVIEPKYISNQKILILKPCRAFKYIYFIRAMFTRPVVRRSRDSCNHIYTRGSDEPMSFTWVKKAHWRRSAC